MMDTLMRFVISQYLILKCMSLDSDSTTSLSSYENTSTRKADHALRESPESEPQDFYNHRLHGLPLVDKSLLIKDLLTQTNKIILFARPENFGKSLNLDMIGKFFSIHNSDTYRALFVGGTLNYSCTSSNSPKTRSLQPLAISSYPEIMEVQGEHPVIQLSLSDLTFATVDGFVEGLMRRIRTLFLHLNEIHNFQLSGADVHRFQYFVSANLTIRDAKESLHELSYFLHKKYKRMVVVLLDDYDVPLRKAFSVFGLYSREFKMIGKWFADMMVGWFQNNEYLRKGVITGILGLSKDELLAKINLIESNIFDKHYSAYFGFTENETNTLMVQYEDSLGNVNLTTIRQSYGGYFFGGQSLYCPSSIIRFVRYKKLDNYWLSTGNLDVIKNQLWNDRLILLDMNQLLNKRTIKNCPVAVDMSFADLHKYISGYRSCLVHMGYLNPRYSNYSYDLRIVNTEALSNFKQHVNQYFKEKLPTPQLKRRIDGLAETLHQKQYRLFLSLIKIWLKANTKLYLKTKTHFHSLMNIFFISAEEKYAVEKDKNYGKGKIPNLLIPAKLPGDNTAVLFEYTAATVPVKRDDAAMNKIVEEKVQEGVQQVVTQNYTGGIFRAHPEIETITIFVMCFWETHLRIVYHTAKRNEILENNQFVPIEPVAQED